MPKKPTTMTNGTITGSEVEKVKQALKHRSLQPVLTTEDYLSTGSTLVNLALTGDPYRGYLKGKIYYMVGDSQAGKTFFSLTASAEASINPAFDDYRIVFDDNEGGALMNFERYFGARAAARIEPPKGTKEDPVCSDFTEEMYFNLDTALKKGPCLYMVDSVDGLSSESEEKKFLERKLAHEKNRIAKGEFTDGKAKLNSSNLRRAKARLRDTGSILLLVGQTRDNVGAMPFEPTKTRSGGRALTFYATCELWLSVRKRIKKEIKGKQRILGILTDIHVKKNRTSGKDRTVTVPIYYTSGVDDVGSCVAYLIDEGHWRKGGKLVGLDEELVAKSQDQVIKHIEDSNLEDSLRHLVAKVWHDIEAACSVNRKPRYH